MIPKLHYISQGNAPKEHLENIQKACSSGIELVQLGLKNVSEKKFLKIAKEAREITAHYQTRLILCDHYKIAKDLKADGVHLGNSEICPSVVRAHLYSWQLIGGTANTVQDCETLIAKEVDYICLGPFSASSTTEDSSPVLGLNGYTAIIEVLNTKTPMIGFGGITLEAVSDILDTGISGISVSEAITRDFNSIGRFHKLLKASSTEEQRYTFE